MDPVALHLRVARDPAVRHQHQRLVQRAAARRRTASRSAAPAPAPTRSVASPAEGRQRVGARVRDAPGAAEPEQAVTHARRAGQRLDCSPPNGNVSSATMPARSSAPCRYVSSRRLGVRAELRLVFPLDHRDHQARAGHRDGLGAHGHARSSSPGRSPARSCARPAPSPAAPCPPAAPASQPRRPGTRWGRWSGASGPAPPSHCRHVPVPTR